MKRTSKKTPKHKPGGLWIPMNILCLPDVKPIDQLVMARVYSFQPHECSLSNEALGEPFNASAITVKRAVRRLRTKGYLLNRTQSQHFRRLVVDCDEVRSRGRIKMHLPKPKRVVSK